MHNKMSRNFNDRSLIAQLKDQIRELKIEKENIKEFSEEYGELLKIEHNLEMELLPIPKSMEESVSPSDLNVIEKFFDLSSLN